jgi:hypothetical protein
VLISDLAICLLPPKDLFETLTIEIIQEILSYIDEFVDVESLLSTSSWVNQVFQARPRRITLDLLKSNPFTTMPEVQQLLLNVVILESSYKSSLTLWNNLFFSLSAWMNDITRRAISQSIMMSVRPEPLRASHKIACSCQYTHSANNQGLIAQQSLLIDMTHFCSSLAHNAVSPASFSDIVLPLHLRKFTLIINNRPGPIVGDDSVVSLVPTVAIRVSKAGTP